MSFILHWRTSDTDLDLTPLTREHVPDIIYYYKLNRVKYIKIGMFKWNSIVCCNVNECRVPCAYKLKDRFSILTSLYSFRLLQWRINAVLCVTYKFWKLLFFISLDIKLLYRDIKIKLKTNSLIIIYYYNL